MAWTSCVPNRICVVGTQQNTPGGGGGAAGVGIKCRGGVNGRQEDIELVLQARQATGQRAKVKKDQDLSLRGPAADMVLVPVPAIMLTSCKQSGNLPADALHSHVLN